jgi:hypothetical protein
MSDDSWRDASAYAYQSDLPLAGVAWEFLRRNSGYQAEFDAAAQHRELAPTADWGLSAFADPNLAANRQPICWRPQVSPRTIVLTTSPIIDEAAITFDPALWGGQFEQRQAADGVHYLLQIGAEEHRLWAPKPLQPGQPLVVAQPLDAHLAIRAEATARLFRHLAKPTAPPKRPGCGPLVRRAIMMLRALDGRAAGASQRRIAEVILGVYHASPREWEDSAARATIARLLRCGATLKAGGYLDFLRRGRGR